MWSARYHVTTETSRFILSTGAGSGPVRRLAQCPHVDKLEEHNERTGFLEREQFDVRAAPPGPTTYNKRMLSSRSADQTPAEDFRADHLGIRCNRTSRMPYRQRWSLPQSRSILPYPPLRLRFGPFAWCRIAKSGFR